MPLTGGSGGPFSEPHKGITLLTLEPEVERLGHSGKEKTTSDCLYLTRPAKVVSENRVFEKCFTDCKAGLNPIP